MSEQTTTQPKFAQIISDRLARHIRFKRWDPTVRETLVNNLAENFADWKSMADYGEKALATDFEISADDAASLIATATSEAGSVPAATVSLQADLTAIAATAAPQKKGKWDGYHRPADGLSDIGSPRPEVEKVLGYGKAARALILYAAGVVPASLDFAARVRRNNVNLGQHFMTAYRDVIGYEDGYKQGQWIKVSPADFEVATDELGPVMTDRYMQMVEGLGMIGSTAGWQEVFKSNNIPISTGNLSPYDILDMVVTNADHIRRTLTPNVIVTSEKMMADIGRALDVFAHPGVHDFYRVPFDPSNKWANVGEVLLSAGYDSMSDWFNFANSWNDFAIDWAQVLTVSGKNVDFEDLFMMAMPAGKVKRYAGNVKLEGGRPSTANSFRADTGLAQAATPVVPSNNRFISFIASLSIKLSASVTIGARG